MWAWLGAGVERVNDAVGGVVWGAPLMLLILGTGLLISWRTGFFQVVRARLVARTTFLAIFRKRAVTRSGDGHAISQFQALSTALAATIGTGNIAGVTTAVATGGPGAVFWMWVGAFFGMMTKYAEAVLAVYYRKRSQSGEWCGGAMYYLDEGLKGKRAIGWLGRPLAILFALFCALAALGIGNMAQVNSISAAMLNAFGVAPAITGVAAAAAVGLVLLKGAGAVGRVTERLVPFMALFYIAGSLAILLMNARQIPYVFSSILRGAFNPQAVTGGIGGTVIMRAMDMGFKRGVFSNEAGLGSSAMAHACADVREPVEQGMWGILEVFVDTIVVCTLTAFTILSATTSAPPVAEALHHITTQAQYVRIGGQAQIPGGGQAPLIDAELNQVLPPRVAARPGGATRGAAYGRGVRFESLAFTPERQEDFTFTNVMILRAVPRTDADGRQMADENGNPLIAALEFQPVEGVPLITYAFSQRFGDAAGKLLSMAVLLFAFSTMLGWSFYGAKAAEYLLGARAAAAYKALFVALILAGATMKLDLVWAVCDTLNALMALPNLIGVAALSGVVARITANYTRRRINGAVEAPMLSAYPDIQRRQAQALGREADSSPGGAYGAGGKRHKVFGA